MEDPLPHRHDPMANPCTEVPVLQIRVMCFRKTMGHKHAERNGEVHTFTFNIHISLRFGHTRLSRTVYI
jgi:hypothetical protein